MDDNVDFIKGKFLSFNEEFIDVRRKFMLREIIEAESKFHLGEEAIVNYFLKLDSDVGVPFKKGEWPPDVEKGVGWKGGVVIKEEERGQAFFKFERGESEERVNFLR